MWCTLRSQTPQNQAPRWASHHRVKWPKFIKIAVCITPSSQAPRFVSYCGVKLHGVHPTTKSSFAVCTVHHTAESSSAVCITLQSQTAHLRVRIKNFAGLLLLLEGQWGEILLMGEHIDHERKDLKLKSGFTKPKIFDSAVSFTPGSQICLTLWSNISAN